MHVAGDLWLFTSADCAARARAGDAYADTGGHVHANEYAYGVLYPLPYPDLDSNAAATYKDADPHGQPDVDADGYADADRYVDADEYPDAGLPRRPYPIGAVRRRTTNV